MIVDFHRCKGKAIYWLQKIFFPCKNLHVGKCRENAGGKRFKRFKRFRPKIDTKHL